MSASAPHNPSGLLTEYMISLDAVLFQPGYEFIIDDFMIFDDQAMTIQFDFQIDMRQPYLQNVSESTSVALPDSTVELPVVPGLPKLSHPVNNTYIAIVKADDYTIERRDLSIDLNFSGPVPESYIRIKSVELYAGTDMVLKPIWIQLEEQGE